MKGVDSMKSNYKKKLELVINEKIIRELSVMIKEETDMYNKAPLIMLQLRFMDKRDKIIEELNNL